MPNYDAGEITTNGISVPIQVDDLGQWLAEYAGQHLRSDSRDKLKGKLARLTKTTKVEVQVPIILIKKGGLGNSSITVRRGVATGLHSANGNVLATWTIRGKETKEQISSYGYGDEYVAGDTSDEQLKEYAAIVTQLSELRDRESKWLRAHKIDPKKAVQSAIDARLGSTEQD